MTDRSEGGQKRASYGPPCIRILSTKYFDNEIGLYDYGLRPYSPDLGRWLSRDPMGEEGGFNLYGFVYNDPLNSYDYLGLAGPLTSVISSCAKKLLAYLSLDQMSKLMTRKMTCNEISKEINSRITNQNDMSCEYAYEFTSTYNEAKINSSIKKAIAQCVAESIPGLKKGEGFWKWILKKLFGEAAGEIFKEPEVNGNFIIEFECISKQSVWFELYLVATINGENVKHKVSTGTCKDSPLDFLFRNKPIGTMCCPCDDYE